MKIILVLIASVIFVVFYLSSKPGQNAQKPVTNSSEVEVNLENYLNPNKTILKAPPQTADSNLAQLQDPKFAMLRELILDDTKISGEGLKSVAHLELDKLYLTNTKVNDSALAAISEMTSITQLSLKNTEVTDKGIAKLAKLPIRKIYLNHTAVTDGSVSVLKQFSLDTLYIESTKISDLGLRQLKNLPISALNINR